MLLIVLDCDKSFAPDLKVTMYLVNLTIVNIILTSPLMASPKDRAPTLKTSRAGFYLKQCPGFSIKSTSSFITLHRFGVCSRCYLLKGLNRNVLSI